MIWGFGIMMAQTSTTSSSAPNVAQKLFFGKIDFSAQSEEGGAVAKTYSVKRYNRFNCSDEEIIVRELAKEQAEAIAQRLQSADQGLGGTTYTVIPD